MYMWLLFAGSVVTVVGLCVCIASLPNDKWLVSDGVVTSEVVAHNQTFNKMQEYEIGLWKLCRRGPWCEPTDASYSGDFPEGCPSSEPSGFSCDSDHDLPGAAEATQAFAILQVILGVAGAVALGFFATKMDLVERYRPRVALASTLLVFFAAFLGLIGLSVMMSEGAKSDWDSLLGIANADEHKGPHTIIGTGFFLFLFSSLILLLSTGMAFIGWTTSN